MTTKPRPVDFDRSMIPGLAAAALFTVMATAFMTADFSAVTESFGFPGDASVVAGIGRALIGLEAAIPVESFVVALIVIAIALDAALDGALMLAKRDDDDEGAYADGGSRGGER
ncbi:proton-conducting membrane transporter [Halobacteriales archaeon Cl-PHB]